MTFLFFETRESHLSEMTEINNHWSHPPPLTCETSFLFSESTPSTCSKTIYHFFLQDDRCHFPLIPPLSPMNTLRSPLCIKHTHTQTHFLSTMLMAQLHPFFSPSLNFSRLVCMQPDSYQTRISSLEGPKYLTAKSKGLVPVISLDPSAGYEFFLWVYCLWPFFLFFPPKQGHSPQLSPGSSLSTPYLCCVLHFLHLLLLQRSPPRRKLPRQYLQSWPPSRTLIASYCFHSFNIY